MLSEKDITFENIIIKLQKYWNNLDFVVLQPIDIEVGAGTLNPQTFFNILQFDKWNCAYIEKCRRPLDSGYGQNKNKLQTYFQFQVINKPSFYNIKSRYLESLVYLGFNLENIDLKFIQDNWEHPALGAYGTGWEVWGNGIEITQITYLKQCGGVPIDTNSTEITYGLERIAKILQKKNECNNIIWNINKHGRKVLYKDIYQFKEKEDSFYNFYLADMHFYFVTFEKLYIQACFLIYKNIITPAYEKLLKCSHILNILNSLGVLSIMEKMLYLQKLRFLSKLCVNKYLLEYKR